MPPITKLKGKQIKEQDISDALIGGRIIEAPTPSSEEKVNFSSLTEFIQYTANLFNFFKNSKSIINCTLLSTGWVNKKQTLTIEGVTNQTINTIEIDNLLNGNKWADANVFGKYLEDGKIEFECENVPTDHISFRIIVEKK